MEVSYINLPPKTVSLSFYKNIVGRRTRRTSARDSRARKKMSGRRREQYISRRSPTASSPEEESEDEDLPSGYHQISIQVSEIVVIVILDVLNMVVISCLAS